MTAYGFKDQFAHLIREGSKIGTIRKPRVSGHVKPGGKIQLFTGLRTKEAQKIMPDVTCFAVNKVKMKAALWRVHIGGIMVSGQALKQFARAEGFENEKQFFDFFQSQYPDEFDFEGVHILWEDPKTRYPYLRMQLISVLPHSQPSKTVWPQEPKTTSL